MTLLSGIHDKGDIIRGQKNGLILGGDSWLYIGPIWVNNARADLFVLV